MKQNLVKINDIINIYNSYITLLAQFKRDSGSYGIVFHDPSKNRIVQLFDSTFAQVFRETITNFPLGMTTGSIVGLARERTPADIWHSDTIERNISDKNSLHQGIRRIVEKEDGIPVYINSIKVIGNISPALAYALKGNPTEIHQLLQKYNQIQRHILKEISKGKPQQHATTTLKSYSAGEGYKSENRLHTLRARLGALTISPENE
ncbi:MAG: hypothetical protein PHI97_07255 [Desulfobulbus sp.]|nr:hypothetical protein [Desulfobulbus sp.]